VSWARILTNGMTISVLAIDAPTCFDAKCDPSAN